MEWLAEALQRQQGRRDEYLRKRQLNEMAAAGEIALDDPRMAGINPGLDAFLAQANPVDPAQIMHQVQGLEQRHPADIAQALMSQQALAQRQSGAAQMPPSPTGNQQFPPTPETLLQEVAQAQTQVQQPAAAPVAQQASQPMQSSQSIIAELERAARPMPEALPAEYVTTLAKVLGNEQINQPVQSSQIGQPGTPSQSGKATPENTFLGVLSDPSISRFLLGMGSALSQGVPFGAAVKAGVDERDRDAANRADAPYRQKKREIDLNKTVADTVKTIAEAGQAEQLGYKAKADAGKSRAEAGKINVETPLTGYNAQTDRIKAQAAQLSAQAAYKQSEAAIKNAFSNAGGKDNVMTDKERMSLTASTLEAVNENIILKNQLQEQGIDALEFVTYSANTAAKNPENLRYLPLDPSKGASLQQEFQRLRALPDTPETQAEVKAFEDRLTRYKLVYGKEALTPLFRSQQ